jgi:hypothetical protein
MDLRLCALLLAAVLATGCGEKRSKIATSCQVTANKGVTCTMENQGPDPGLVCFDAVVKCSMGDKRAKFCSDVIPVKARETQSVAALEPPIGLRETCYHAEIQNAKVRPK